MKRFIILAVFLAGCEAEPERNAPPLQKTFGSQQSSVCEEFWDCSVDCIDAGKFQTTCVNLCVTKYGNILPAGTLKEWGLSCAEVPKRTNGQHYDGDVCEEGFDLCTQFN